MTAQRQLETLTLIHSDSDTSDSDGSGNDKPNKRLPKRTMKDRYKCFASFSLVLVVILGGAFYWQLKDVEQDKEPAVFNMSDIPARALKHKDGVALVNKDGEHVEGPSLYCFMVVLPYGEERDVVNVQFKAKVSIFQCDAHDVLSSEEYPLGDEGNATTVSFGGDMHTAFNSWTWSGNAMSLNTQVFLRAWKKVYAIGTWAKFDFTIKTETDTVFIPWRLKALLASDPLVPASKADAVSLNCTNCTFEGTTDQTCASHAKWVQDSGVTCVKALEKISDPKDCNCNCDESACHNPESVYLRNCAHNRYTAAQAYQNKALHGPIEVLSKKAYSDLGTNISDCEKEFEWSFRQWGEDWFLEHCLLFIGVNPIDSFSVLDDVFCSGAGDCKGPSVTFQPKKAVPMYFGCLDQAENYGSWPPYGVDVTSARPTPAPTTAPTRPTPAPTPAPTVNANTATD